MRRLMLHGALAGVAGGAAMAVVLALAGEGPIARAIAIERQRDPGAAGHEMFSRGAQQGGGAAAAVLFGLVVGIVLAVVFTSVRPRLAELDDWRASTRLAVVGLVTVFVVPFLHYPANPPAVGDPDTIGRRTMLYLALLAWSAVATWATWRASRALRQAGRLAEHWRVPAIVATYLGLVGIGYLVLPGSPDAITAPATLVWQFRLASLAGAAAVWLVTGTVFGWLRVSAGAQARATTTAATTAGAPSGQPAGGTPARL